MTSPPRPIKVCPTCGRTFAWRKKWARSWDQVVHCSDRCRGRRAVGRDELEVQILAALAAQPRGAAVALADDSEPMRAAARRLAQRGVIELVQRGVVVDPDRARGLLDVRRR